MRTADCERRAERAKERRVVLRLVRGRPDGYRGECGVVIRGESLV